MNRNTIIGLSLIVAILGGTALIKYLTGPSAEEIARMKHVRDSTAFALKLQAQEDSINAVQALQKQRAALVPANDSTGALADSLAHVHQNDLYGPFAQAATGNNTPLRIENDVMVLYIEPKGGRVQQVFMKDFKNYHTKDTVHLFNAAKSAYRIQLPVGNRLLVTDSLYFSTEAKSATVTGEQTLAIPMRLYAGGPDKYVEFLYTVKGNEYMVGFDLRFVGMQGILNPGAQTRMEWNQLTPTQEKDPEQERGKGTIYYKENEGDVSKLGTGNDDDEVTDSPVQWVAFSQQFFTTTLVSSKPIDKPIELKTERTPENDSADIRSYRAFIDLPVSGANNEALAMQWYFGPKDYKILKKYDMDLEEQISLGWWLFRYVNTLVIINLFQWLDGFNLSYGLIILILTLIVKLVLSPITYKTYLSSAKMRVLKPDIDALNEKNKDADPMKKQQEVMNLYRKAGVNPLAGCIPALLQMPILFAIFQFFPSSIELRGQAFLWADDLSSWDSIVTLPFTIPFYGDHVSLFTLLMTATTMIYTSLTQSNNLGTGAQAQQMKIMMYVMPILFLGVLNSYSAALSYYYFLANAISILQTLFIRRFVIDENKLRSKIEENKKRPDSAKKSGWTARLEQMQKVQQQRADELKKKKK